MSKPQSAQPASAARHARRPLTDFTLPETTGASVENLRPVQLPVRPPLTKLRTVRPRLAIAAKNDKPAVKHVSPAESAPALKPRISTEQLKKCEQPKPEDREAIGKNAALHAAEGVTMVAAKVGRDYQSWILAHAKTNVDTALGYANQVTASLSSKLNEAARRNTNDQGGGQEQNSSETDIVLMAVTGATFYAKAFEFMSANVNSTFDYAHKLGDVKSAAEFVRVSATHMRRQMELTATHTAEFRKLTQTLARR